MLHMSYGLAESFVSTWLQERKHLRARKGSATDRDIMLGSKWGYYYTADWAVDTGGRPHEVKDHSVANLVKQTEESDTLLGSNLGLYQIHSATLESGVLEDQEVLKELEKIKLTKGWKIGLSCSGPRQGDIIKLALRKKVASDGSLLFDSIQATFNLMEQGALEALVLAKEHGAEIIVKEAVANGRVLQKEILKEVAKKYNSTPDAVAMAAVLVQPFQPMVLSGASNIEQLASNFKAVSLTESLSPDDVNILMKALQENSLEYWAERSRLPWN
jgi:aryl-alcohol dehydrogenase-like predicted oxidoreductase